ncbi:MAG: class I SAM-dependent methyltransferase [Rhodobacteraceae bacterium]|jgi:SAM-dependent methyltransferase|nr:class I SAM-dependent methyltransferase [Paracoccaceae bacterium]
MRQPLSLPDTRTLAGAEGARLSAPSAERNAAPILAELGRLAPATGRVLEVASGTGQHAAAFAAALPGLDWQPTEASPRMLASIEAWRAAAGLANLRAPVLLDATQPGWGRAHPGHDLALVVNLLHLISGGEAQAVLAGMAEALLPGGLALFYGPFRRGGALTSDGDRAFDASLRTQDPAIGYKDTAEVGAWAAAKGLTHEETVAMPANNLFLVFRRA